MVFFNVLTLYSNRYTIDNIYKKIRYDVIKGFLFTLSDIMTPSCDSEETILDAPGLVMYKAPDLVQPAQCIWDIVVPQHLRIRMEFDSAIYQHPAHVRILCVTLHTMFGKLFLLKIIIVIC